MRDVRFRERTGFGGEGIGVVDYGVADCGRHFVVGGIGEADVQNCLFVILGEADGAVYGF